jgi:predicted metal-dependent peptidase
MKDKLSRGKIDLAIARLASSHPLHAGILAQWRVEEDASVETMGVGFGNGRLRLVYAPDFVESISMDELTGVLHHESNHVLFDHVLHKPAPHEDSTARTTAEEITVNEWIAEPLPAGCVLLEDYPFLPENEDTDTRYERLRKRIKDNPSAGRSPSSAEPSGEGAGQSSNQGGGKPKRKTRTSSANGIPTVDNHATWEQIAKNADQAKAARQMDSATAWGSMTEEEKSKVDEPFSSIARAMAEDCGLGEGPGIGKGIGSTPGAEVSELDDGAAHVPWQVVLRRYVGKILERRPVFGRPPRRFPDLVGVIPGKGRFASEPKVMAIIDTSGSMSDEMLADIAGELGLMAQRYEVTVVECDAEIHAVYPYKPLKTVHGRGGTDFRPPLKTKFLKKHKPDLIVFFTDGYGPAPSKAPRVPVMWAITEDGTKPVPWGQEIALEEPETSP